MCVTPSSSPSGSSVGPLAGKRVGYVPVSRDCAYPTDARLFCHYAKRRGVEYRLVGRPEPLDVVVLSQMADLTAWRRASPETKLVFIFENPYFAIPHRNAKSLLRGTAKFLSRQHSHWEPNYTATLRRMCGRADAVLTSTEEQRRSILPFCSNVVVMEAFHTGVIKRVKQDYARGEALHIVWEGLGGNVRTLGVIRDVLRTLSRETKLVVHLVTDLEYAAALGRLGKRPTVRLAREALGDVEFTMEQWDAETLSRVATECDLAVIPLPLDSPFERGKAPNKLLLFWRMGVPVVASATPAYRREMEAAGLDLACETGADWLGALRRLAADESARAEAGRRGMAAVEERYGEEILLERWDRMFASLWDAEGR